MKGTMRMRQMSKPLLSNVIEKKEVVHRELLLFECLPDKEYYKKYLKGLEDFIYTESLSLTTAEYYNISEEILNTKDLISRL